MGLALTLTMGNAVAGVVESFNPPVPAKAEHAQTAKQLAQMVGGPVMRVASTRSMEPVITAEHLLILKPVNVSELNVGDIIVFERRRSGGMMIGHRIIETKRTWVVTKGDNLREKDEDLITQDMLLGRVALLVNGQTGVIHDLLHERNGVAIDLEQVLARLAEMNADVAEDQ